MNRVLDFLFRVLTRSTLGCQHS